MEDGQGNSPLFHPEMVKSVKYRREAMLLGDCFGYIPDLN